MFETTVLGLPTYCFFGPALCSLEFSLQNKTHIMLSITGVATDMIAVMEMQSFLGAKPKQTSISGSVRTRKWSVVLIFFVLMHA